MRGDGVPRRSGDPRGAGGRQRRGRLVRPLPRGPGGAPAVATYRTPSGEPVRLLVGDETALPAIGATVEQLPAGTRAVVVAEVAGVRRHLVSERGLDRRAVSFTGYWRRNLTQDDAPSDQDMADAVEQMEDTATT